MQPLAERLRPRTLDEYIGQKHLVGPGAVLRKMIDAGRISSFILWGPPGVGKTTLAQIIANKLETPFYTLSAVTSGVKDVRDVIERAKSNRFFLASQSHPLHRRDTPFQQVAARLAVGSRGARHRDADRRHHGEPFVRGHPPATIPLPALYPEVTGEGRPAGTAATRHHHGHRAEGTENRTERNHCHAPLQRRRRPQAAQHPRTGDRFRSHRPVLITDDMVTERLQQNPLAYDKDGEMHYDIISAFIKSIRGSDPDGAIYWLARM